MRKMFPFDDVIMNLLVHGRVIEALDLVTSTVSADGQASVGAKAQAQ